MAAEKIWSLLRMLEATTGCICRNRRKFNLVRLKALIKPSSGEIRITPNITSTLFHSMELSPEVWSAAPISPPITAWDEDDGSPMTQVRMFQAVAAAMAAMIPPMVMASMLTIPCPIVFATAVPKISDPKNTSSAVMIRAFRMFIDLDDTMVVTIFDAS
jgi:hypothetical protein